MSTTDGSINSKTSLDNFSNLIKEKLIVYTDLGIELASQSVDILEETVNTAVNELEQSIRQYAGRDYQDKGVMRSLTQQLETIKERYEHLPVQLVEDILSLPDETFTITLFGRTEAGKSTLMNVLTHGDGAQIGIGDQRTTRNVRPYSYRGLNVVDVPGIAAAGTGGMEDEELAFEYAKRSDLIIFLIMGDAQESEARCLAHIKELGKPVLLLLNVHVGITDSDGFDRVDLEDFEYEMQDEFDQQHLDAIRQSLIDYGPKYGQNWSYIPYAYVHLKAAYMAQKEELSDYADDLYKLSRFDDAVCLIEKEVCESGGYFRLKSYSDSVSSHLIGILESLFEQSAENSRQGRLLVRTRRTLERWIDGYIERSEARINAFVDSVRDDLKGEANIFAEDNYNNRKAAQAWNKILASKKIEAQANDIIRDLERECNDRLTDLRREIDFDTKLGKYIPRRGRFKAYDVIDAKKTWNWGTKLIAGALTIGGIFITKELFIAGIAVGAIGELGSRIFGLDGIRDDARRKMRNQLYSSINQQCEWLNREMQTTFSKCIVKDQLTHMCKEIDSVVSALFELSNVQRNLAIQINKQLRILNRATLNEALAYLGYQGQERSLVEIARIPGVTTALILNDGTKLPSSLRGEVGRLLGEFIRYVFFTENTKTLISRLIERGFDRNKIRIDRIGNEPRIAHITGLGKLTGDALTGIRLAEQITELVIME